MGSIRNLLFTSVLVVGTFSNADEVDDFLEAFGRKDWAACLEIVETFDPMDRFIFDDEGKDIETTPFFVIMNNLEEESPSDVLQRIALIRLVLPRTDPNVALDSRYDETAFECFVEQVVNMDIFSEFATQLRDLFVAFLERGAVVTDRAARAIARTPMFRSALATYHGQRTTIEPPRDQSPLRQRMRRPESSSGSKPKRQRSSSHKGFHIAITPAIHSSRPPLSPIAPTSAPSRMIHTPRLPTHGTHLDPSGSASNSEADLEPVGLPHTPRRTRAHTSFSESADAMSSLSDLETPHVSAPRAGFDAVAAMQGLTRQMQHLVSEVTRRMNNFDQRLQEAEAAQRQMMRQRELDITEAAQRAVERALARLGFGAPRPDSKQ